MNRSEHLDKLIPALVAARSKFTTVVKDKTAKIGTYAYKYADLSSVLDAVTPALSENGLTLVQPMTLSEGILILETCLFHASGQWIGGTYPVPMASKAQELGSAITYGRRYSITALLGIVAEDDDDGAAASQDRPERKPKPPAVPAPASAPTAPVGAQAAIPGAITEEQRKELRDAARAVYGNSYILEMKRLMLELTGKEDSSRMDQADLTLVRRALQNYADKMAEEGPMSESGSFGQPL